MSGDEGGRRASCGCRWTPGIDLPTTECEPHSADPMLAHGPHDVVPFAPGSLITTAASPLPADLGGT
jgi:hypothetical protein